MELKVGDLIKHRQHNFYGVVIKGTATYKGCLVCEVQWVQSNKRHLIDQAYLDKINKT